MKDVNEARHVKLCQMTVKMDKVLVYLGYIGLFLWGREINQHNLIWGLYSSIMVIGEMLPRHIQELFGSSKLRMKRMATTHRTGSLDLLCQIFFFMKRNEKRINNQMLLLFLKMMKIQIPKMLGMMTRRVKQRSNRLKNYEDFIIVTCSLDALSIIML